MTLLASGTKSRSCAKVLSLTLGALFCSTARAQQGEAIFSVDWQGQTTGEIDASTGFRITDGDLLFQQLGPLPGIAIPIPEPQVVRRSDFLSAYNNCVGHLPGVSCGLEIDAISLGLDAGPINSAAYQFQLYFSVDEWAVGNSQVNQPGSMRRQAIAQEAAADVFITRMIGQAPFGPNAVPPNNLLVADGDGFQPLGGGITPGLGLIEPSPPTQGVPDMGSNLDAFDLGTGFAGTSNLLFFSLQNNVTNLDEGLVPFDSAGTQLVQGQPVSGADILVFNPSAAAIQVYATADELGLDNGTDLDDIDAIIVVENGDPGFQCPDNLYDWNLPVNPSDLVLFSVRKGSSIIGTPDSLLGLPIVPGDILIAPCTSGTGPFPALLGPPAPGIFVAAENLGLEVDRLNNMSDDIDAIDLGDVGTDPIYDCNSNGVEDSTDIADGSSMDANSNGIPDECEDGCVPNNNSTGVPTLLTGTITPAPGSGLHLEATNGPPSQFGYFLIGTGLQFPGQAVGGGLLCLATAAPNALGRYNISGTSMTSIGQFDAAGVLQNLVGTSTVGSGFDVPSSIPTIGGTIMAGDTWYFQTWHRDVPSTSNFSNAIYWMF